MSHLPWLKQAIAELATAAIAQQARDSQSQPVSRPVSRPTVQCSIVSPSKRDGQAGRHGPGILTVCRPALGPQKYEGNRLEQESVCSSLRCIYMFKLALTADNYNLGPIPTSARPLIRTLHHDSGHGLQLSGVCVPVGT